MPTTQSSAVSKGRISKEFYKEVIFKVCPTFQVDDHIKPLMNELFFYANGEVSPQLKLDPNKGILLWGSIGTGKSTIIKILGEVLRPVGGGYKTVNCSYLANQFAATGLEAVNSSTYNESDRGVNPVDRAFDELGREPIPAKHFGNELNIMQYVFQCRYELRSTIKTHATTNINPKAIGSLYGDYIADRMSEMFNIIELKGKSRR